jgi:hypothetical protein
MKKIFSKTYSIVVLVAILLTTLSCEDWLDPMPLSFLSPENTFVNAEGIETLLNKCRSGLRPEFYGRGQKISRDYWFSDMFVQVNGQPKNLTTQLLPSSGESSTFWNQIYTDISYANMVVSRASAMDAPESVKNPLIAEGKFFLAYWYYKMVNRFGDCPLVITEITTPKLDFKTTSKEKIIETMITYLEFAVEYLPETAPNGAVSRAAAQHLLTKYYLQVHRFQDAVDMATNVINNPQYALMKTRFGQDANDPTKNVMWDLFRKYNPGLPENKEKILVVQDYPGIPGGTTGSERMREFLCEWYKNNVDSQRKQATTDGISGEPQISNTGRGIGKVKQSEYYGYQVWKDPNDLRHKPPCWIPIDSLVYNRRTSIDYGKHLVKSRCLDTCRAWDDIYWNKIVQEDELIEKYKGINIVGGCIDWYVFRLAETYLLRAEAYVWLNMSEEAANDINEIRTRAGALPIPTTNVTIDDVLDERARELFLEEYRCIELTRISYIMASLNMNGYSLETISQKNYYHDRVIEYNQFYRTNYVYQGYYYRIEPYHIYWPIPESAILANTQHRLNQNYGYPGYEENVPLED